MMRSVSGEDVVVSGVASSLYLQSHWRSKLSAPVDQWMRRMEGRWKLRDRLIERERERERGRDGGREGGREGWWVGQGSVKGLWI